ARHVVEGAVRLEVVQFRARRPCQGEERSNLVDALVEDLLFRAIQFAAAEVLTIGEARVGAGADTVFHCQSQGGRGRGWVAGMAAAGDVRRRDQRQQVRIVRTAFAQVAVQVDLSGGHGRASGFRLFSARTRSGTREPSQATPVAGLSPGWKTGAQDTLPVCVLETIRRDSSLPYAS